MLLNNQIGQKRTHKKNKKKIPWDKWNLRNVGKAVLKGRFMVINAYLKKQENPQTLYFRELQREKKNEVQNQTVMKQTKRQ